MFNLFFKCTSELLLLSWDTSPLISFVSRKFFLGVPKSRHADGVLGFFCFVLFCFFYLIVCCLQSLRRLSKFLQVFMEIGYFVKDMMNLLLDF